PDVLLHEDALVLHQTGACHARHGLARGVGHQMDVEIATRHVDQLTPQARLEKSGIGGGKAGTDGRLVPTRPIQVATRLSGPILHPLWMTWNERPANRESTPAAPIRRAFLVHSRLGTGV